jgi:hypothetical protein
MRGTYAFERNGMSVVVTVTDDKIMCMVKGVEVYQLFDKETEEVYLSSFASSSSSRNFLLQNPKFFPQKIS